MIKFFCEKCNLKRECSYKEEYIEEVIDGIKINYLEKYYICSSCGNKIYGDMLNYNIKTSNNELRKKTGLITIDEINEILNKYNIGKKALSLVLGFGEITITRYIDGQNPNKENSDLLKYILDNPILYEMYLEVNKDKISEVSFKKSFGKTKQIELVNGKSKIYNVSLYIIKKLKEIDALSLQKLLYFSNAMSKYFLGENIINEKLEAWKYGPVYRDIYNCFSYYGFKKLDYDELLKNNEINLTDDEKKYLDKIIEYFGFYSGSALREMTHLTDPWINNRQGLDTNESSNRVISNSEINSYFNSIIKKYNIKCLDDIKKYSVDLFKSAKKKIMSSK